MRTHILGFPRIGPDRELKRALESYWKGDIPQNELTAAGNSVKEYNWKLQSEAGLSFVTTGDFSFYDHVLDTVLMLGMVPGRFRQDGNGYDLDTYFTMARGDSKNNIPAMEMTKWFNTNYHYIVPEFSSATKISNNNYKIVEETGAARSHGYRVKPVLLGPLTFVQLGKQTDDFDKWTLLESILSVYRETIEKLGEYAEWIQIDEPVLCTDMPEEAESFISYTLKSLAEAAGSNTKLMLATYFESLEENIPYVLGSGFDALHIDTVSRPARFETILNNIPEKMSLSLGLVDGRNIWKTDLGQAADVAKQTGQTLGRERVFIGSSCSLLHTPVDLDKEEKLDEELRSWMSFAKQKCREIALLGEIVSGEDRSEELKNNRKVLESRREHPDVSKVNVRKRASVADHEMMNRNNPYGERKTLQKRLLNLPLLPTTTIGSFPQTQEIRKTRLMFRRDEISKESYENFLKEQIQSNIDRQEELGLDVLVHGEPERNDMVEYFGQQLEGFCFTENGWVQSYGSRCVKPPVIYGDVSREEPMTVGWIKYAQSLTDKPVKGMLTGPVTILCWSFVRDDMDSKDVCRQIALAIRDEVIDLEKEGIKIIQIDEAAFREGMPLKQKHQEDYLKWAVDCFRITSSGVMDETQIHSHMCYSEFNDIVPWIAKMDADVISIESSRSNMELLDAFREFEYPNEIGPGVYDIHSPRVPTKDEIKNLIENALSVVDKEKLWINPDCGLKTRQWPETTESLGNMVAAAGEVRDRFKD